MKTTFTIKFSILLLFIIFPSVQFAQTMEEKIDQLMSDQYKADDSGATILIAKKGEVVYRKAFGKSNLELDTDMIPENVFEIGSITKQFTAVGILMLLEEGKLSLDDEITKFIPDYPTQGTKITVHHLLTHTSGIKSYTSIPALRDFARKDISVTELIDMFKNEPMDFKPNEKFLYNNSGYILLGYIIEKVSGISYEEFIQKRIFDVLKMENSLYGSKYEIVKNRAAGYQKQGEYLNADYISMTIPYAAGSIMSTVDDMFLWHKSVRNNTLISKESLAKAFKNYTLDNGKKINYGYGWSHNMVNGVPVIEHGGGIFGYTTHGIYVPSENAYIIILTNCNCNSPTEIAFKIAAIAIGKPYPELSKKISLTETQLQKRVGAYEFEDGVVRFITLKDNQLYSQRADGNAAFKIFPLTQDRFFFENSFAEYIFTDGTPKKVVFKNNIDVSEGVETDKKMPEATKEVQLSPEILKRYVGTYKLAPEFNMVITVEGNQIFVQATGQPRFELFASSENNFFLKVVDAKVIFKMDKDTNTPISLVLEQGGQKIPGAKVED